MNITIKETGEVKTLSIVDTNGIEWTQDLLGNNDATTYNKETEQHEMSQDDFDWWKEYIENNDNDEEKIKELAEELNIDADIINDRIMTALQYNNDLGDEHQIKQNVFEEITEENKNI